MFKGRDYRSVKGFQDDLLTLHSIYNHGGEELLIQVCLEIKSLHCPSHILNLTKSLNGFKERKLKINIKHNIILMNMHKISHRNCHFSSVLSQVFRGETLPNGHSVFTIHR